MITITSESKYQLIDHVTGTYDQGFILNTKFDLFEINFSFIAKVYEKFKFVNVNLLQISFGIGYVDCFDSKYYANFKMVKKNDDSYELMRYGNYFENNSKIY